MGGPRGLVIALDGVISAGKSTVARAVATELGYRHLDTGAMYRTVALMATRGGIEAQEGPALQSMLDGLRLELGPLHEGGWIRADGEDVSQDIRTPEVSRVVGSYADLPMVRRALVAQQQAVGRDGGVVAEGRDMSSVVFPDADLKVFMVADLAERAARRHREFEQQGLQITLDQVVRDIEARDREDAERDYGGVSASDIVEVDTTGLTIEAVVARIISLAGLHDS